jgi:hypothetical protein
MKLQAVLYRSLKALGRGVCLLGVLMGPAHAAETVSTDLFSLEVPDQWTIEGTQPDSLMVLGGQAQDALPLPILTAQYCVSGVAGRDSGHAQCAQACDASARGMNSYAQRGPTRFSPLHKSRRGSDAVEYRSEMTAGASVHVVVALSCSKHGQVFLSLVSDQDRDAANSQFEAILKSLRWRP